MSWSETLPLMRSRVAPAVLALLGLLPIAGCGFHPLYAERSDPQMTAQLASIQVAPVPNHIGQYMTNMLNDDFHPRGERAAPKYQLELVPIVISYDKGTRLTGTASRTDQLMIISYRLIRLADNAPVLVRSVTSRTGFDQNDNQYTNVVSKQSNQLRQARDLVEQIEMNVAAYMEQTQGPAKS